MTFLVALSGRVLTFGELICDIDKFGKWLPFLLFPLFCFRLRWRARGPQDQFPWRYSGVDISTDLSIVLFIFGKLLSFCRWHHRNRLPGPRWRACITALYMSMASPKMAVGIYLKTHSFSFLSFFNLCISFNSHCS